MNALPKPVVVADASAPNGPADGIDYDLACHCGYNLRGLRRRSGRCPECGRGVDAVFGEFEQASLDGLARRRFGAALLIGNHLAWLSMMAGWFLYIRADLRAALTLLAAAGPRSVTAIEIIKPGTLRIFSTTVFMLLALHLVGLRLLTTVYPFERLRDLRRLGHQLWATQVVAAAAAITLFVTTSPTTLRLLIWLNLIELPVGVLLGAYLARLGRAEGDRRIERGGRAVSWLLAISSLIIAGTVFFTPPPNALTNGGFYAGLSAAAVAGALLIVLLFRIRAVLGCELIMGSDDA